MTEESRVSRTPRTWTEGSGEPEGDAVLFHKRHGRVERRGDGWLFVAMPDGTPYPEELAGQDGWRWKDNLHWPLVEVLPDAPQPEDVEHDDLADHPLEDRSTWAKRRARLAGEDAPVAGCGCCDFLSKPADGTCVYCNHRARAHRHYTAVPARGSSSEVSSVSPEGETTPGEGEGRTEALRDALLNRVAEVERLTNLCREYEAQVKSVRACTCNNDGIECNHEAARGTAELGRDALQTRIADVVGMIDMATSNGPAYLSPGETSAIRAALQGDQPTAALSGVELRSVEERDDASEEQP